MLLQYHLLPQVKWTNVGMQGGYRFHPRPLEVAVKSGKTRRMEKLVMHLFPVANAKFLEADGVSVKG